MSTLLGLNTVAAPWNCKAVAVNTCKVYFWCSAGRKEQNYTYSCAGFPRVYRLIGLLPGKKTHNSLSVTLIKVGTHQEKYTQAYESDYAVHLLQGKDIVNEDFYNRDYE